MARPEPLTDANAFVELLEKSDLLAPEELPALKLAAQQRPDAAALARDLIKDGKLSRWQAGQLLHGYWQLAVGKYRLMEQLGKGPVGRAYLAEHGKLNKRVSLKVLSPRFNSQADVLKQFLDEANRAGALNHRNLVHIFDVGNDNDKYYVVMEYVGGKTLQQLVEAGGALPPKQALGLLQQAADGLAHAHEQKLTHGDLKPSNLIVDDSGVVKILDVGLSGLADTSSAGGTGEDSSEGPTLASLAFRAPELLAGQKRSDVRSDLYSLGAVLYFLLTGKPPSRTESDNAQALAQVPGVVPELLNLCDHLLATDSKERPESALELGAALTVAQRAIAATEKAPPPAEPERPSSAGKASKPLVARPLAAEPQTIVLATDEDKSPDDDPLAGFSIKTGRKRKPAANPGPVAVAAAEEAVQPARKRPAAGGSRFPLWVAGAIGGAALVIVGLVAVIVVLLNRDRSPVASQTVAMAGAKKDAAAKAPAPTAAEANPESNPEANPAAADVSAAQPQAADEVAAKGPAASDATPPAADTPMPPPATGAAPTEPMPPPPATDTKTEPATAPATTTPAPTTTTPPAPTTPAPSPTPAPQPEPARPFDGFAAAVALPPIEDMGKPIDAVPPAVSLGPVKLPPMALCLIKLKGGETAYKGKSKFTLDPANQGTAERDWEFKLQNDDGPAVVIATLSLKEDQLAFQWTDEALQQQAAPYLGNCALSLAAGPGTHVVALREPLKVEPLAATVDKGTLSEKYNLDYAPGGKQISIEFGPITGGPAKQKNIKPELEAFKDTTFLQFGLADDAMFLGYKIDVTMPAKSLQITAQPQFFFPGLMPKPDRFLKNTLVVLTNNAAKSIQAANINVQLSTKIPNQEAKKKAETKFKSELEQAQKGMAQIDQLKEIVKSLEDGAQLHFRAYYLADDAKVELITTGGPPPAAAMPPAAAPPAEAKK